MIDLQCTRKSTWNRRILVGLVAFPERGRAGERHISGFAAVSAPRAAAHNYLLKGARSLSKLDHARQTLFEVEVWSRCEGASPIPRSAFSNKVLYLLATTPLGGLKSQRE